MCQVKKALKKFRKMNDVYRLSIFFWFQIYKNPKLSELSERMRIDNSLISENSDVTNMSTDLLSTQICCIPAIICKNEMKVGVLVQMK